MSYSVPRSVVQAFYEAHSARDVKRLAPLIHDDVEWTISGPVDILSFCGTRQGKAAVLDLIERVAPAVFDIFRFVQQVVLIDGDRAATLNRLSARRRGDGRVICYRVAHFVRFRDDKVIEYLSLLDSFDAVEQVLGHPLPVHAEPAAEDLVAV